MTARKVNAMIALLVILAILAILAIPHVCTAGAVPTFDAASSAALDDAEWHSALRAECEAQTLAICARMRRSMGSRVAGRSHDAPRAPSSLTATVAATPRTVATHRAASAARVVRAKLARRRAAVAHAAPMVATLASAAPLVDTMAVQTTLGAADLARRILHASIAPAHWYRPTWGGGVVAINPLYDSMGIFERRC
jgi:hypothetical protein